VNRGDRRPFRGRRAGAPGRRLRTARRIDFERSCSDAAIAALVLARLRCPEARPVIERLLLEAPEGEERAALAEAASLYRSTR
jgi:hypothetical protein